MFFVYSPLTSSDLLICLYWEREFLVFQTQTNKEAAVSKRNDDTPFWVKPLAQLISGLILFACMFAKEFIWNPDKNYSVEVRGDQVVVVEGVTCHNDPLPWQLAIKETWYSAKKSYAKLYTWLDFKTTTSRFGELEVHSNSNLNLPSCTGETTDVAYIWDISSSQKYMHLRVHPNFKVFVDNEQKVPR
jgi:hypothetical protein